MNGSTERQPLDPKLCELAWSVVQQARTAFISRREDGGYMGQDWRPSELSYFDSGLPRLTQKTGFASARWTGQPVFSRDCAEYEFEVRGDRLLLMVNHFRSKGYGSASSSNESREAQAGRVAEIYRERLQEDWKIVIVLGDFNDTPDGEPLAPVLGKTDKPGASQAVGWVWGEREGTFGGAKKEKIDYLVFSPDLFGKVTAGGVDRKGFWRGDRSQSPWGMLPTLTKPEEAASDHAAVWVELELKDGGHRHWRRPILPDSDIRPRFQ